MADRRAVEELREVVAQRLGLRVGDGQLEQLGGIMDRRCSELKCDATRYLQRLDSSATSGDELRQLARQLTVTETYFMRNADHFRAFREVALPRRLAVRAAEGRLRLLSAACASGEEPYSMAMVALTAFPELARWELEITAFDLNPGMLEKAHRGLYSDWSLRAAPPEIKARFFRGTGGIYLLDEELRSRVRFEERNILEPDPLFWQPDSFDIIFCRNVLMYFTLPVIRRVVARLAGSLAPGGYLFLGHAETLRGISQSFHLCHTHDTFYYARRETLQPVPSDETAEPGGLELAASPPASDLDRSWVQAIHNASERIGQLAGREPPSAPAAGGGPRLHPPPGAAVELGDIFDLLRRERFAEALGRLETLPPELSSGRDVRLLYAVLLTNCGRVVEARRICEQILEVDDLDAGAHYLLALGHEHAGDLEQARLDDDTAVYLDPSFAMPRLHLGLMARKRGDLAAARRELEQALPLLSQEDASRILLFGGGFSREALTELARSEMRRAGGQP